MGVPGCEIPACPNEAAFALGTRSGDSRPLEPDELVPEDLPAHCLAVCDEHVHFITWPTVGPSGARVEQ